MIDPALLEAELDNDPASLGYAARIVAGDDNGLMVLLNDPSKGGTVHETTLTRGQMLLAIAPAYLVLPTLSAALQGKWDRILAVISASDSIPLADPRIAALLATAVADGVLTQGMVAAIGARAGSRAEVLFGVAVAVTDRDISFALRGDR